MPDVRDESILAFPDSLAAEFRDLPPGEYAILTWSAIDTTTGRRRFPDKRRLEWSEHLRAFPELSLLTSATVWGWRGWGSLSVTRRLRGTGEFVTSKTWTLLIPEPPTHAAGEAGDPPEAWTLDRVMSNLPQIVETLREVRPVLAELRPLVDALLTPDKPKT